jgi:hypothetical protein
LLISTYRPLTPLRVEDPGSDFKDPGVWTGVITPLDDAKLSVDSVNTGEAAPFSVAPAGSWPQGQSNCSQMSFKPSIWADPRLRLGFVSQA